MQHPPKRAPQKRRMTRKALVILTAALLVLALALVLLLPTIKRLVPSNRYPLTDVVAHDKTLATHEASALDSIEIAHIAGDSYTLRQQNGAMYLERDGELLAIDPEYSRELMELATTISVQNTVTADKAEVAGHLSDMGFDPPQTVVRVRYLDGGEQTIELGLGVPETTYSYYRWSGDDGIYMCDIGVAETFAMTANRLLPVEQPTLEKSLIDRVTLSLAGGRTLAMSFATDAAGSVSGWLESPYRYPMSAEAADAMLTAITNFRLGVPTGELTEQNRVEYGFDQPLVVVNIHRQAGARAIVSESGELTAEPLEEQTVTLTLGRETGDYFYTCLYDGHCYEVSRFLCAAMVEADAARLVTLKPADLGGAAIAAIAAQTGAGTLDARVTRTERVLANNQLATDDSGNILYDAAVTINGEAATVAQFDALTQRLAELTVGGALEEGWSPDGKTPRWRLTLVTEGGTTREIAAYALDAFSDALVVDGTALHYASADALEAALAEWTPAL